MGDDRRGELTVIVEAFMQHVAPDWVFEQRKRSVTEHGQAQHAHFKYRPVIADHGVDQNQTSYLRVILYRKNLCHTTANVVACDAHIA